MNDFNIKRKSIIIKQMHMAGCASVDPKIIIKTNFKEKTRNTGNRKIHILILNHNVLIHRIINHSNYEIIECMKQMQ